MSEHLDHDELVQYFYREGDTRRAGEHMESCAGCRAALERLERELELADGLQVPERAPGYADEVWARVNARLAEESAGQAVAADARLTRGFDWSGWLAELFAVRRLAYAGGLAALLLVVFWLGYGAGGGGAEPIPERVRERRPVDWAD